MARVYLEQGNFTQARKLLNHCLMLLEQVGDLKGKAAVLSDMAHCYEGQNKLEKAIDLFEQSLFIKDQIGDLYGKALALVYIGAHYINYKGDFNSGIEKLYTSYTIMSQLDHPNMHSIHQMLLGAMIEKLRHEEGEEEAHRFEELLQTQDRDLVNAYIAEKRLLPS